MHDFKVQVSYERITLHKWFMTWGKVQGVELPSSWQIIKKITRGKLVRFWLSTWLSLQSCLNDYLYGTSGNLMYLFVSISSKEFFSFNLTSTNWFLFKTFTINLETFIVVKLQYYKNIHYFGGTVLSADDIEHDSPTKHYHYGQ